MNAGRLCTRVVATAAPTETVRAAATRMSENDVGTLVVLGGEHGVPIGLVTDRDLVVRCIAAGLNPDTTPVSKVSSAPLHVVDEQTPIEDALSRIAQAGVRRLVVTGPDQSLVGVLSLDDVLDLLVEEVSAIGRLLQKQAPTIAV